jgi:hypothetical protein
MDQLGNNSGTSFKTTIAIPSFHSIGDRQDLKDVVAELQVKE